MVKRENIEAVYSMTEKQESLAVFSLSNSAHDPGYIQLKFKITGALDKQRFEKSWQLLLDLHQSMRMTVQSPDNQPSMIVALKACEMSMDWHDLSGRSEQDRNFAIDEILEANLKDGFDLSLAPVHKLVLLDIGNNETIVLWSCHHLFLDGWSAIVILNDLAQIYGSNADPNSVPRVARTSYGDYLRWLKSRDEKTGESFWREELRNFDSPTYICKSSTDAERSIRPQSFYEWSHTVDVELSTELNRVVSQLKITPATLIYGAWCLLLTSVCGTDRSVFGSTSSGRAHGLPDGNLMTGYFANLIPIPISLRKFETIRDYLQRVQKETFRSYSQEHWPLSKISAWSGIADQQELFDHLVLVENLPQQNIVLGADDASPVMGDFSGGLTSKYPLTLTVSPGGQWRFKYIAADSANRQSVADLAVRYERLLECLARNLESSVDDAKSIIGNPSPITIDDQSSDVDEDLSQDRSCSSTTEIELQGIWEELLGVDNIGAEDDFLSLGGRSIIVVKMLASIERVFEKKISLLEFIKQPTISHLATLIDGTGPSVDNKSLIPFRVSGTATPVVFVHAVGTHALFLRSVVKYIDQKHPVYGLQPVGLDGLEEPMESIDSIADHYISELLPRLTGQSVHLVSHCLGAVVAFDIMKKLESLGIEVKAFIVIDATPPQTSKRANYAQKVKKIAAANENGRLEAFGILLRRVIRHIFRYRLKRLRFVLKHWYVLNYGSSFAKNRVYMERVHASIAHALDNHITSPYAHDIQLISSQQDQRPIHLEWTGLTDDFTVHELPIRHMTLFIEPEVSILGARLQRLISDKENTLSDYYGDVGSASIGHQRIS